MSTPTERETAQDKIDGAAIYLGLAAIEDVAEGLGFEVPSEEIYRRHRLRGIAGTWDKRTRVLGNL